ncbi:hypothetical protein SYNPS1DRAFT_13077, partial [Syncephalis pseudoplumigaleata]
GMIPNFQDAILNIIESSGSGKANDDNWLHLLHEYRRKRFIFYGDETWLNFAAPIFKRHEGTSSFFVADTVEVDTNVTRHVEPELARSDWDVMILHYLGLDHIGHSSGPKSPLMPAKQREMDNVVRVLYERTKETDQRRMAADPTARPTLIVLCGDHGMNEIGGHGGSSPGETSPALIFLSPSMTWPRTTTTDTVRVINQIDVVPTISLLFGVPSPRNSLGNLVPELFASLARKSLYVHARMRLIGRLAMIIAMEWIRALQLNANQIRSMFVSLWHGWDTRCLEGRDLATVDCATDMDEEADELMAPHGSDDISHRRSSGISFVHRHVRGMGGISLVLMALYYVGLFASSYIEEEHQMWYFIVQTIWLGQAMLACTSMRQLRQPMLLVYPLVQMVLLRVLRTWNQTGNATLSGRPRKYSPLPTLGIMLTLVVTGGAVLLYKLAYELDSTPDMPGTLGHAIAQQFDRIHLARIAYLGVLMLLLIAGMPSSFCRSMGHVRQRTQRLQLGLVAMTLLLLLLARLHNVFVFVLFGAQLYLLVRYTRLLQMLAKPSNATIGLAFNVAIPTLALQHAAFFALGNSNALSSVELNNAYTGLTSFVPAIVGLLTFICNWSGPIWWTMAGMLAQSILAESEAATTGGSSNEHASLSLYTSTHSIDDARKHGASRLFFSVSLLCLSIAVTVLRYHLFIWTVFSPKYLYQAFWMVFHLCASSWLLYLGR